MNEVSAIAYSSSANLGPGYDSLGLAHNAFYNTITISRTDEAFSDPVKLHVSGLPASPYENTAGLAVTELLKDFHIAEKFIISIHSGIPTGLGLGSSGASAAAAIEAINELLELKLDVNEKVKYAMLGEAAASGAPHADNVAASIAGGLVIVESVEPVRVKRIKVKEGLRFLTVVPEIKIESKTKTSRGLVPGTVDLKEHIQSIRYTASLISGLMTGDNELIRAGMNDDIVEKAREPLFPFYPEIKRMMLDRNAVGVCISGAGPSVLAVVDENTRTDEIEKEAKKIISGYGHMSSVSMSTVAGGSYVR